MRNFKKRSGGDFVWFGTLPKGQGHYITLIQQKKNTNKLIKHKTIR
jgi:hypothetical protein